MRDLSIKVKAFDKDKKYSDISVNDQREYIFYIEQGHNFEWWVNIIF